MIYLANAFSLGMIDSTAVVKINKISLEEVKNFLKEDFVSAVGHKSTAEVLTLLTGIAIPVNRIAIKIQQEDYLIVFQLNTRLEEGRVLSYEEVLTLPYNFYSVKIISTE